MNINLLKKIVGELTIKLTACLLLFIVCPLSMAQSILSTPQTGTLQVLEQDDGYLVVSGVQYGYDAETTKVIYNGAEVDDTIFEPGLVIRFQLRGNMMEIVEIIGPYTMLEDEESH